ncbi:MAG TPA: hypothetical protein VGL20_00850 [Candidatus Dormibacteraeota bacterium]|jgi:hypothetical protein
MEQGGVRGAPRAGRSRGGFRRRTAWVGLGLIVAGLLAVVLLTAGLVATWTRQAGAATRITLTMPCARVDSATVGRRAYGLDQVLSASCSSVTAHR